MSFPAQSPVLRRSLARRDICPECGGALDTGWECNACGYDARDEAYSEVEADDERTCHMSTEKILATQTPMRDHVSRFWHLLATEHVYIAVNIRREHDEGQPPHWDSSTFGNDVAKAILAASRVRSDAERAAVIEECAKVLEQAAEYWTTTISGLETGDDVSEWISNTLIPDIRVNALAANAAEGETDDPRTTLHTVISDIREASGLGGRPMLGELAGEIGKLRERADQVAALTKERDDARATLASRLPQDWTLQQIADARLPDIIEFWKACDDTLAARPAASAVGELVTLSRADWDAFQEALSAIPQPSEKLRDLLRSCPPWQTALRSTPTESK